MKKYLLIIILFSTQLLFSQSKKQFSSDVDEFETELVQFLKVKGKKGQDIANSFIQYYSLYSKGDKKLVIDILNGLRKSRLKKITYYNQVLKSIILIDSISKDNGANKKTWLVSYGKFSSDKSHTLKQKQKYIEGNFNVLSKKQFNPKTSRIKWGTYGKLFYSNKNIIKYSIDGDGLFCSSGVDSLFINSVKASYVPSKQEIELSSGKVFWDPELYSEDSLFVTIKNIIIDIKKKGFKADSVVLNDKIILRQKILGSIVVKTESSNIKNKRYPIFKSYVDNNYYKNIVPGIDFSGGVEVKKNAIYGLGNKSNKAIIHCKTDNKDVFLFKSKSFIFNRNNIFSPRTDITIRMKDDSIFHPEVVMNYNILKSQLSVSKNNSKLSKSPFSNSYNKIDMYLEKLVWNRGSNTIRFNTERFVNLPFVSNYYYERGIFSEFQGLNNVNPLVNLYHVYKYSETDGSLSITYVAQQMGIPKQYTVHLLMELAVMGYVYIDLDLDTVIINEKFINIVEAYQGNSDSDAIVFATPKDTSTSGSIDLDSGYISVLGIKRISLSTKKKVYVFPSDTVKVKKNMNLSFNGELIVGDYEFHGSDYSFNYDEFKVLMNGNQQMHYYVKTRKRDSRGKIIYAKVVNPIDSLRGELFIDEPTNKSGRYEYPVYPKFSNNRDAFVFFDSPKIRNGIYSRENLYAKLYPFELDSLTTVSPRDVVFNGTIYTGGIFPEFEHFLKVQRDNSLGFIYDTGEEGLSLYNKGVYRDTISLNTKGLKGNGRISYLSSEIESDRIEFYMDILKANAKSFNVKYEVKDSINTPLGFGKNVAVFWKPENDSMVVEMLRKPFVFYDGSVEVKGDLAFLGKNLIAKGNLLFETAEINSDHFNFYGDSINSSLLNFELKETLDSPSEVEINNSTGVIDMTKREGRFMLNDKNSYVEFVSNKYIAYIDSVVWKMDTKTINLNSTSKTKSAWFVSVDPLQDSLRFQASKADYHLVSDKLQVSEIEAIVVADALVYPENNELEILDNGWMQGFEHAKVKIGVGSNEHLLENVNVVINSSHGFKGDGHYFYTDIDKIRHRIDISSISIDSLSNKSVGRGDILPDDEFMLNPYFSFNGVVEVSGKSPFLMFKGYSSIQNYCDRITVGEIPIMGNINPEKVKVVLNNYDNLSKYSFLYNGIYSNNRAYSAALLSTDRDMKDYNFISAKGSITYNEPDACYILGGDTIKGVVQDELRFYNDECRLNALGEINFYNPDKVIEIKSYGSVDYDMNARIIDINALLGLNFKFNKSLMVDIQEELQRASSKGFFREESKIQKLGFSKFSNKPYSTGNDASVILGGDMPKELRFDVLFSNVKFTWDPNQRLFLSGDDVGVHSMNGSLINKIFKGKIEVKKRSGGDDITFYIETQNGKYFYFSFRDNVLNFYTNNRDIMDRFDNIDDRDRNKTINGIEYRFKKASKLNVKSFQSKYLY